MTSARRHQRCLMVTLDDNMIIRTVKPKKYPRIVPLQINFTGLNVHNVIFYKAFVSWRFFFTESYRNSHWLKHVCLYLWKVEKKWKTAVMERKYFTKLRDKCGMIGNSRRCLNPQFQRRIDYVVAFFFLPHFKISTPYSGL